MVIFRKLPMEQLGSTFRQLGSAAASDFKQRIIAELVA
jgi:hypothetical protein